VDAPREEIISGYQRACHELDGCLANATPGQLTGQSAGTKWTNEELLFHMVFGYMVFRALVPLVRIVSRLPQSWGRDFASALDAATVPFDSVNYWASRAAARVYNRHRMGRKLERTTRALARHFDRETPASLERSMNFPTRWDPFFASRMSLTDVYAYPTLHFDFHRQKLHWTTDESIHALNNVPQLVECGTTVASHCRPQHARRPRMERTARSLILRHSSSREAGRIT
jgi:hypothetical protein